MDNDLERMETLLEHLLDLNCPVLSGNMKSGIEIADIKDNEITIVINAPFYDLSEWKKTGVIKHTGKSVSGITDYAALVNSIGPFGHSGKSKAWVNRCCYEAALQIASEIGATVINELPLI